MHATCPRKYTPIAQMAAAVTVPNTANMVIVLRIIEGKHTVCFKNIDTPYVFKKVEFVEAVAMLEQDHRQKIQKNGAGLRGARQRKNRLNALSSDEGMMSDYGRSRQTTAATTHTTTPACCYHTCIFRKVAGLLVKMLTPIPIKSPKTMAMNGSGTVCSLVIAAHTRPMNTVPSKQIEKNRPQLSLYIRLGAVSQLAPSYPGQQLHLPSR
jgi:predicted protein tyrosine phosphatase